MYKKKQIKNTSKLIEILGWVGVVMGLIAYTLIVFRLVSAQNSWYLLLNVFGSLFLIFEAVKKTDWQSVVVNAVIGGFALINFVVLFFV
jgi:hypothetical protein